MPLPEPCTRTILHDLAEGLASLHSQNILHRNLTSAAVYLKGSVQVRTDRCLSKYPLIGCRLPQRLRPGKDRHLSEKVAEPSDRMPSYLKGSVQVERTCNWAGCRTLKSDAVYLKGSV